MHRAKLCVNKGKKKNAIPTNFECQRNKVSTKTLERFSPIQFFNTDRMNQQPFINIRLIRLTLLNSQRPHETGERNEWKSVKRNRRQLRANEVISSSRRGNSIRVARTRSSTTLSYHRIKCTEYLNNAATTCCCRRRSSSRTLIWHIRLMSHRQLIKDFLYGANIFVARQPSSPSPTPCDVQWIWRKSGRSQTKPAIILCAYFVFVSHIMNCVTRNGKKIK